MAARRAGGCDQAQQLAAEKGQDFSVCLIEKAAEIGAHILSGGGHGPEGADRTHPRLEGTGAPLNTPVSEDRVLFLSETGGRAIPNALLPDCFVNHGNYIVRLGNVVKWLGRAGRGAGRGGLSGFAGAEILFDENGAVKGVATGDMGLTREGEQGPAYAPGMELHAGISLFAEGCRGHLGKQLEAHFKLRDNADPQTYGIGIKSCGKYPLQITRKAWSCIRPAGRWTTPHTAAASFTSRTMVAVGYVVGLNYPTPSRPSKSSSATRRTRRSASIWKEASVSPYGARAIAAGGLQSPPKLTFPGGGLIGDDAGFLNAARIKGAATRRSRAACWRPRPPSRRLPPSASGMNSPTIQRLSSTAGCTKNCTRPATSSPYMKKRPVAGSFLFGAEQKLFKGNVPRRCPNSADHTAPSRPPSASRSTIPSPTASSASTGLERLPSPTPTTRRSSPAICGSGCGRADFDQPGFSTTPPEVRVTARPAYEIVRDDAGRTRACRSMRRTVCIARPATSRILPRISTGSKPQGGEGPIYQGCGITRSSFASIEFRTCGYFLKGAENGPVRNAGAKTVQLPGIEGDYTLKCA